MKPVPPCICNCPNRSMVCHDRNICPAWGKFEDDMVEWREAIKKANDEQRDVAKVRTKGKVDINVFHDR